MFNKEKQRKEMLDRIRSGGAWFVTGTDRYTKIGYSKEDNCYMARECFLKDGKTDGGAYTFGTDWFDISFHGKYIDLYADADTFKHWDIDADAERDGEIEGSDLAMRLLDFCRDADAEALAGGLQAYRINSTNFSTILEIRSGMR